jgi:hypothetical protein
LVSKGTFVLAKDHGLLWLLKTPLQQDYRITPKASPAVTPTAGNRCRTRARGRAEPPVPRCAAGDSSGLQRDFELPCTAKPSTGS